MTPQMQSIFKKSLKSNRWDKIDLGPNENYTHENMVNRWVTEKNKWLEVSSRPHESSSGLTGTLT